MIEMIVMLVLSFYLAFEFMCESYKIGGMHGDFLRGVQKEASENWHSTQPIMNLALFSFGFFVGSSNPFLWKAFIIWWLFRSALFWVTHDAGINFGMGRPLLFRTKSTTSFFRHFSFIWLKSVILLITIILLILFLGDKL